MASQLSSLALAVVAAALAAPSGAAGAAPVRLNSSLVRLIEWNVYWGALDDSHGRLALASALDAAAPSDFVVVVEAEGDTPAGSLESWSSTSAFMSSLAQLNHRSRHETIAVFHDPILWLPTYHAAGEFEPGRPWLLVRFQRANTQTFLWVCAVHLPHFLDAKGPPPGETLAGALRAAANATGGALTPESNLILAGDWNEYEWEDNGCRKPYYPPDCRKQAAAKMAPLWHGWLQGTAVDVVPNHTITCCTKWAPKDRHTTDYHEWSFEYDHVFVAGKGIDATASSAALIPYTYPGTAAQCADPACTGEDPPSNVTALHQGAWHRGWMAQVALK